ncbi:hypothetical protein Syun_030676 [Stephania yunnanensis]|uniref:Uncharacterized protein n=1 Tax=Stephania yunnanensis TaxID=152371 RepID=A0AAP0DTS8_9MAGN
MSSRLESWVFHLLLSLKFIVIDISSIFIFVDTSHAFFFSTNTFSVGAYIVCWI